MLQNRHTKRVMADPVLRVSDPLAIARTITFFAVLFKHSGMRIWTHAYAGEVMEPSRLVYYSEFLVTLLAFATTLAHISAAAKIIRSYKIETIFIVFCTINTIFLQDFILASLLFVFGYAEIFFIVFLIFRLDGVKRTISYFAHFATVFVILNILSIGMPSQSFMIADFAGIFRGLTAHRNDLSQIATIILIVTLYLKPNVLPLQNMLNLAGSIVLIVLARSAQGIVLSLFAALLLPYFKLGNVVRTTVLVAAIAGAVVIAAILFTDPTALDWVFEYFGRDSSFSGRDRIWSLSLYLISVMPFFGYGLGFFSFDTLDTDLLREFQLGTLFGSTHNSYLEGFVAYGWIGGILFAVVAVSALLSMLKIFGRSPNRSAQGAGVLLLYCLAGGITATEKMFSPTFGWLSFVLALAIIDQCKRRSAPTGVPVGRKLARPLARRLPTNPGHLAVDGKGSTQ